MQRFACECGNVLFFESTRCLSCGNLVGYDSESETMTVIKPGSWMKLCDNGAKYGVCNWVVPASSGAILCRCCHLNRMIPDLRNPRNILLWGKMEAAKRRLISTLLRLGFSLPSKADAPAYGLAFDIVSNLADPKVTIGHLNGVITVNLEEADDTYRQINRQQLGESARTLLGHFRHETGHYVWQRWLSSLDWADPQRLAFRERFGNEWLDYASALNWYYQSGGKVIAPENYISNYAASHPWEDWAETWAHYLQIRDGLETCEGLGLEATRLALPKTSFPPETGRLPQMLQNDVAENEKFLDWLARWVSVSTFLNETSASLGQPLPYPFVVSVPVAHKLRLVHHYVGLWGSRKQSMGF
jgi:hypothetical protein